MPIATILTVYQGRTCAVTSRVIGDVMNYLTESALILIAIVVSTSLIVAALFHHYN